MEATEPTFLESLVPYWPGVVTLLGFFVVGGFAIWNRRNGSRETKTPSVAELWADNAKKDAELDIERNLRRWFQEAFFDIRRAFRLYRDRHDHPLTSFEQKAFEAQPPNLDKE